MTMDDATALREQVATEAFLDVRRQVWLPTAEGRDPASEALAVLRGAEPRRVLEVGCGTGEFAARLVAALPDTEVLAVDLSERMVDLTARRGVAAQVADLHRLPFPAGHVDAAAALWMLHHLDDVPAGIAALRRVLAPGGVLVAVTHGAEHVAALRREAGGQPIELPFSSENGESLLRASFDAVVRHDFATRAVFGDHASALAYLQAGLEDAPQVTGATAWELPYFEGAREETGQVTLFIAS